MGYLTRNVKKASKTSVRKLQRRSERRLPNTGVSGQSELSRMIHGVEYRDNLVCTELYSTVHLCTVLYSTILYSIVLYITMLYLQDLYSSVLYYFVLYSSVMYRIVQYCAISSSAILL